MNVRVCVTLLVASALLAGCKDKPATPPPNASTPPANANAQWFEIGRTAESVVYLDTARIERPTGGVPRIWYRFVWLKPFMMEPDTTQYTASEVYEEVDCALKRTKILQVRMEGANGVSAAAPTPDLKWRDMATDPMHKGISHVACRTLGTPLRAPAP